MANEIKKEVIMNKEGYKNIVDTMCQLTSDTPNNMELGKKVRRYMHSLEEKDDNQLELF